MSSESCVVYSVYGMVCSGYNGIFIICLYEGLL